MIIDLVLFLLGLGALYLGSEWLVEGAGRLAAAYGISSFVIGLTLVAFGTSAPELVVTGLASLRGAGGLAVGNVVGSNIANIALILGLSALIRPISVHRGLLTRDVPIMIAFAGLLFLVAFNLEISRVNGGLLLALFVWYMIRVARDSKRETLGRLLNAEAPANAGSPGRLIAMSVAGLIVLVAGAHVLVVSSVDIARSFGVPEVIIGLTLVAFGTSVPELAASIAAARRNEGQIIIGNILGSNIFNSSLVIGFASMVNPLPVQSSILRTDMPLMIVLSVLLLPLVFTKLTLNRWEGAALLSGYVGFIAYTALLR